MWAIGLSPDLGSGLRVFDSPHADQTLSAISSVRKSIPFGAEGPGDRSPHCRPKIMGVGTAWSGHLTCNEKNSRVRIPKLPPTLWAYSLVVKHFAVYEKCGVRFSIRPPKNK